jgi:hypothetical protein
MEVVVTPAAANFFAEGEEKAFTLTLEVRENNVACGGMQRFALPEIVKGRPSKEQGVEDFTLFHSNGVEVYIAKDIEAFPDKPIVIDLEEIAFLEDLVVNNVKIPVLPHEKDFYTAKQGAV